MIRINRRSFHLIPLITLISLSFSSGLYVSNSKAEDQEDVGLHVPNVPLNPVGFAEIEYCELTWDPPMGHENNSLIGYRIYRGTTYNSDHFFKDIGPNETRFVDTDVHFVGGYYYWVSAFNSHGESDKVKFDWLLPILPPTKPGDVKITKSEDSLKLEWKKSSQNVKFKVQYLIMRSTNYEERFSNIGIVNHNHMAEIHYFYDSYLIRGNTYSYKIIAENDHGLRNESEVVTIDLKGPPTSVNGLYVRDTENSVTLMWDKPANNGGSDVLGYIIQKGRNYDDQVEVDRLPADVRTWEDPDPWTDRPNYYLVIPYNIHGEGDEYHAYADLSDDEIPEDMISCFAVLFAIMIIPGFITAAIAQGYDKKKRNEKKEKMEAELEGKEIEKKTEEK